jgi:hypothetical protein
MEKRWLVDVMRVKQKLNWTPSVKSSIGQDTLGVEKVWILVETLPLKIRL